MKKMLVVDGNSILNRAFYGIRMLTNKDGLYTNAVYGIVNIISKHINDISPDYCAIAFDMKSPTFRHKMYDGYKANRKGMPEELAVQLPIAKDCMTYMGLKVVTCEGFEADDILGTLADKMGKRDIKVYILTGDRDSLQLIDENVSVLLAKTKETLTVDESEFKNIYGISPQVFVDVKALMGDASDNIPGVAGIGEKIKEKYGVNPIDLIEVKGLMGDTSDNIPGVPGIGEKTAFKLISSFGSLSELYEKYESSDLSEGVKKKLSNGREMAFLSKELALINRNAPIDIEAESYEYHGVDAKKLRELFLKLDFTALVKKFGLENFEDDSNTITESKVEQTAAEYKKYDNIADLIGDTLYVNISEGQISLFDGKGIFAVHLDSLPTELHDLLSTKKLICFDSKTLYKELNKVGYTLSSCAFDCMLAAYVLDSGNSKYGMEDLSVRYLNSTISEKTDKSVLVKTLADVLSEEIESKGFSSVLYDIEMPLSFVLADIELAGFKIDREGIAKYGINI